MPRMPTPPKTGAPLPPSGPQLMVDYSEFLALKMLVIGLAAATATERNPDNPQTFVKNLADVCSDSLRAADLKGSPLTEGHRDRAIQHVQAILGAVNFPEKTDPAA